MNILSVSNLKFKGDIKESKYEEIIEHVECAYKEFKFGNVYCFDCEIGDGGWALSWLLSGYLKPENGIIKLDNKILNNKELLNLSRTIGVLKIKKFFRKTVRKQILNGLKKNENSLSFESIIKKFCLSEGRLDRYLEQYSGEKWRANLAVGYANNKRIFSFSWIDPKII